MNELPIVIAISSRPTTMHQSVNVAGSLMEAGRRALAMQRYERAGGGSTGSRAWVEQRFERRGADATRWHRPPCSTVSGGFDFRLRPLYIDGGR